MPDPTPVDPEVASVLLRTHLGDFFANSPHVARHDGWGYELCDDPLTAIVRIPARRIHASSIDSYTVLLDATYYDTWPVAASFVGKTGDSYTRARLNTPEFPLISGSPGAPSGTPSPIEFALHDEYPFASGVNDQLICFSYNFGYYVSGHNPTDSQRWRPSQDRLDATLNRLFTVLNSPAYLGPSRARESS